MKRLNSRLIHFKRLTGRSIRFTSLPMRSRGCNPNKNVQRESNGLMWIRYGPKIIPTKWSKPVQLEGTHRCYLTKNNWKVLLWLDYTTHCDWIICLKIRQIAREMGKGQICPFLNGLMCFSLDMRSFMTTWWQKSVLFGSFIRKWSGGFASVIVVNCSAYFSV